MSKIFHAYLHFGGRRGLAVACWTQSRGSRVRHWSGASFIKFHLISPGSPCPNSAFIVKKSGLKHGHFISFHLPSLCVRYHEYRLQKLLYCWYASLWQAYYWVLVCRLRVRLQVTLCYCKELRQQCYFFHLRNGQMK